MKQKIIDSKSKENPFANGNKGDIDCSKDMDMSMEERKKYFEIDNSVKPKIKPRPKCKSIKWHSSEKKVSDMNEFEMDTDSEHNNWYICPRIWDGFRNIPVDISELKFNAKFGTKFKFKFIEPKWRTYQNSEDSTDKFNGKDIFYFEPHFEDRYPINPLFKDKRCSLIFKSESGYAYNDYIGFLKHNQHPDNLPVPCCFKKFSTNTQGVFSNMNDGRTELYQNPYIQNSKYILDENRIGLLDKALFPNFGLDVKIHKTGDINFKNKYF